MTVDSNARYRKTHEWARPDGEAMVIGISDRAQESLGDVVYVDLPQVGNRYQAGEVFGVIESVKAASDLYAPVSGEIIEVNADLASSPEWVNQDPYGKGWIVRVMPTDPPDFGALLSAETYRETAG